MIVRKLTFAFLATTAMSFAGAAYAADVYVPPAEPAYVPPVEEFSWTGVHFGIDVGGQFDFVDSEAYAHNTNSVWAGLGSPNSQDIYSSANLGAQNWFISGDVGADYQAGNFVVGVFGNYDFSPKASSASHYDEAFTNPCPSPCGAPNGFNAATTTEYREVGNTVTYGDAWGVGLRAGVLVNPRTLLYVLGGFGQKEISAQSFYYYDYYNNQTFSDGLSSSGWRSGGFIGTGLEAAVGKHATVAIEYRVAQYAGFSASCDTDDVAGSCGTSSPGGYNFNEHDFSVGKTLSHTIRARLSWWLNK